MPVGVTHVQIGIPNNDPRQLMRRLRETSRAVSQSIERPRSDASLKVPPKLSFQLRETLQSVPNGAVRVLASETNDKLNDLVIECVVGHRRRREGTSSAEPRARDANAAA